MNEIIQLLKDYGPQAAVILSLRKAISVVTTGTAELGKAYFLDGWLTERRAKLDVRANHIKTIGELHTKQEIEKIENLQHRSENYEVFTKLREQQTREDILGMAYQILLENPPKHDAKKQIENDWLYKFMDIAKDKTDEDFKILFAKILAGEVKAPGSFSPRALNTLAMMTRQECHTFKQLCDLSFFRKVNNTHTSFVFYPQIQAENTWLSEFYIEYINLKLLHDAGIISELIKNEPFKQDFFLVDFFIGPKKLRMHKLYPDKKFAYDQINLNIIPFTNVGIELRKIVDLELNTVYLDILFSTLTYNYELHY